MLAAGENAQTVLDHMANADEGRAVRQAHMIDEQGNIAAFTGDECNGWAGHHVGDGFSVAGNILKGQEVVDACAPRHTKTISTNHLWTVCCSLCKPVKRQAATVAASNLQG